MYIGIDLGGTNIAVGIVDENCNIVRKGSVPTERKKPFEEIVKAMADLALKLAAEEGLEPSDITQIGVGSPGALNKEKTGIVFASSFPTFRNVSLLDELRKYFPNADVCVENDANAAAYGELIAGAAKGLSHVVIVTLGTGVGGGVIIDKKIFSGFNCAAGELGHMVIDMNGIPCECGRRGCWEVYASATALIKQTKEAATKNPDSAIWEVVDGDLERVNGKTAFDAAEKGDKTAKEVVDKYIYYLSVGITDVVNLFQPEAVVIGGGVSKQGEVLLQPVREFIAKESYGGTLPRAEIMTAKLGNDAGIIGAAMLWQQKK